MKANAQWDVQLRSKLDHRSNTGITGYALITHQRTVQCAYGVLEADLGTDTSGPIVNRLLQGFATTDRSTNQNNTPQSTSLEICGNEAIIVRSDDTSYLAASRGNTFVLAAQYLPMGILIVTADGRRLNPKALPDMLHEIDLIKNASSSMKS